MGLHRELRRLAELGAGGYLRHAKRRQKDRIMRLLNRVAPRRCRCSCCGWGGWSFLDYYGKGYSLPRVVCPDCGSQGRHRELMPLLRQVLADLGRGCRVLHLAPERAFEPVFRQHRDLVYVPADLKPQLWLQKLAVAADIAALPFRDNSFSLVLCSHVLEHVHDDRAALYELARVAAAKAMVLIVVPTWRSWDSRPTLEFGMANPNFDDHWRTYGSDLPAKIEACGMRWSALSLCPPLRRVCRNSLAMMGDTLFVCEKPDLRRQDAPSSPLRRAESRAVLLQ
jgi:SAM-dependent methyltransferase